MACQMQIWDARSGKTRVYVCDEQNAGEIIHDDHAATGKGRYSDVGGKSFQVEWGSCRLVGFVRQREA